MTLIPGWMCPHGSLAQWTSPDWPLTGYRVVVAGVGSLPCPLLTSTTQPISGKSRLCGRAISFKLAQQTAKWVRWLFVGPGGTWASLSLFITWCYHCDRSLCFDCRLGWNAGWMRRAHFVRKKLEFCMKKGFTWRQTCLFPLLPMLWPPASPGRPQERGDYTVKPFQYVY